MKYFTYAFGLKFGRLTASSMIIEPFPVLFHFRASVEQQRSRKADTKKKPMANTAIDLLNLVKLQQKM
jgi:hypothetical protein